MSTDILGGEQLGYHTILTLTGTTKRGDLADFAYQPDKIIESIDELHHEELIDELRPGGMELGAYNGERVAVVAGEIDD